MKNKFLLLIFQALSSTISAILISNMSWVGKMGISFLYKEYGILKVWWKTAILLFIVQTILVLLLSSFKIIVGIKLNKWIAFGVAILLGIGLYLTYIDFTTTSHKMMKMSFHIGFYLAWVSGVITCLYFILHKVKKKDTPIMEVSSDSTIEEV